MEQERQVMPQTDPSAIGLFGLAMVTLVASSQKMGWTTGTSYVIPWAIFLGAFAQLYASVLDAKIGNTFGATAFAGYGFFWLGVAMSWMISLGVLGEGFAAQFDVNQLGVAFIGYLIFTLFMTVGAAGANKVLFIIFILIDLLFIGLAFSTLQIGGAFFGKLAAWSEFLIAIVSFYGSAGNVLNKHFGRVMLPLGKPLIK